MGSMTVRRYQSSDYEQVIQLHKLALESVGAYLNAPQLDNDLENIKQFYLNTEGEFLVGELHGKIIAMGAFRKITEQKAEIKRMRVHPDYQRQGLGQMIYDRLEQTARQMEYKVLFLDTTTHQTGAQKFYLKNGYREIKRIKNELELVIYEKILKD